jgi:hypothetical protein
MLLRNQSVHFCVRPWPALQHQDYPLHWQLAIGPPNPMFGSGKRVDVSREDYPIKIIYDPASGLGSAITAVLALWRLEGIGCQGEQKSVDESTRSRKGFHKISMRHEPADLPIFLSYVDWFILCRLASRSK